MSGCVSFLSISVLYQSFFPPLPLLSSNCIHRRAPSTGCDKHPPPPPRNCFNRAACSTFLTPYFFILDIVLPLFFHEFSSHLLVLCLSLLGPRYAALLCQEMKATQNGTRKWSTFCSVLLQLKQAWKSASNFYICCHPICLRKWNCSHDL